MYWRELGVRRDLQNDAIGRGAQNAAPEKHGHTGQTALVLLVRHHRLHHVHRVLAGPRAARDVHDKREFGSGRHSGGFTHCGYCNPRLGSHSNGPEEGH